MVNLLFSWGFIEILRYKQTARIKPLTENCACTFDTAHHGSDQSKPHSIGFLKEKFGVHTLSLPSISMIEDKCGDVRPKGKTWSQTPLHNYTKNISRCV